MSGDIVYNWLLSLGAEKKRIHTPQDRIKFLCKHFMVSNTGLGKHNSKKVLSKLRSKLEKGIEIDAESFVVTSLSAFESRKKWDLEHIAFCRSKKFYQSSKWKNIRLQKLIEQRSCQCCGAKPEDGAVLHVDHILPRSIYPEYGLCMANLQVLCADCNIGKGNTIEKEF